LTGPAVVLRQPGGELRSRHQGGRAGRDQGLAPSRSANNSRSAREMLRSEGRARQDLPDGYRSERSFRVPRAADPEQREVPADPGERRGRVTSAPRLPRAGFDGAASLGGRMSVALNLAIDLD